MKMLHAAIDDFMRVYGKDAKYKSVVDSLTGASSGLKALQPVEPESPGRRAARGEKTEQQPQVVRRAEKPAGDGQPKTFAEATAAAKDRVDQTAGA